MTSRAEFEAAGLYRAEEHAGTSRLELLRWFESLGVTVEAMQEADAIGELPPLASDQRMLGGPVLGKAEALEIAGMDEAQFDGYANALGFQRLRWAPDDSLGYTRAEAELFAEFEAMTAIFTDADALAFVRVIGTMLSRLGEAAVSLFLGDVETRMLASGHDDFEIAKVGYEATGLMDGFTDTLDPILRRHLMQANERTRQATIAPDERLQYRYAVGFVDLVGFTERSASMTPQELARFIREFEARAHDVVNQQGARLVKLIGDEAMFTAPDADAVCRSAKGLLVAFGEGDKAVVPRGGVAIGDVIALGGDYFGPVVNLASRLVDEAVPSEILVSAEVVDAASTCRFEPAGRRMVKGFSDPIAVHSLMTD
ncbi:MAG: adenylate/guanylate cyclase domain-containing protein [Actinomycetota bacterium]